MKANSRGKNKKSKSKSENSRKPNAHGAKPAKHGNQALIPESEYEPSSISREDVEFFSENAGYLSFLQSVDTYGHFSNHLFTSTNL
jgi:hypothetical protein